MDFRVLLLAFLGGCFLAAKGHKNYDDALGRFLALENFTITVIGPVPNTDGI